MNNKGFAITTILYGTMILFLMLILSMLGILSSYKDKMDLLIESERGARTIINFKEIGKLYAKNDDTLEDLSHRATYVIDDNRNVTVTSSNSADGDDGYTYVPYKVSLVKNKLYVFDCNIGNGVNWWGKGGDVEAYLMLDGINDPNTRIHMKSNVYYYFTAPATGDYWLRLDVNKRNTTQKFSNIKVLGLKYS